MHVPTPIQRQQGGFSLIEIMVALVIGMATVVIMLQMLSNSDAAKRITASGNDAQISGTIALFNIERDVREAGYGINAANILGCQLSYHLGDDANGPKVTIPIAPVSIILPDQKLIPRGDDNTDILLVMMSDSQESPDGDPMIAASTDSVYQVTSPQSFKNGDYVLAQTAARPSSCNINLVKIDQDVNGAGLSVKGGDTGLPAGSIVYNLGPKPIFRVYAVRNGNLTVCNYFVDNCGSNSLVNDNNVWVPVAYNVVALRAQYGHDFSDLSKPLIGVVSEYDQITPASTEDTHKLQPQCAWSRALSVRVGLVSRGTAYDKDLPKDQIPDPTWSGAVVNKDINRPPLNQKAVSIDLSPTSDSKLYRYKTFETNIPLRNAIWRMGGEC